MMPTDDLFPAHYDATILCIEIEKVHFSKDEYTCIAQSDMAHSSCHRCLHETQCIMACTLHLVSCGLVSIAIPVFPSTIKFFFFYLPPVLLCLLLLYTKCNYHRSGKFRC